MVLPEKGTNHEFFFAGTGNASVAVFTTTEDLLEAEAVDRHKNDKAFLPFGLLRAQNR